MSGLTNRKEQCYLLQRHVQALAKGGDVGRQQCHLCIGQWNSNVRGTDNFAGESADRLAQLHAEQSAAHILQHRLGTAHHGFHFLGHLLAERGGQRKCDAIGNRFCQALPGRQGLLDPLRPRPGPPDLSSGWKVGHRVEPHLGQPQRFIDLAGLGGGDGGVIAGCSGLPGILMGELPIDRPIALSVHHRLHLLHHSRKCLRIRRHTGRLRQLLRIDAGGTLFTKKFRQHFGQGVLGVLAIVRGIGAHGYRRSFCSLLG